MKYQLPAKLQTRKSNNPTSVYWRIPKDLQKAFNDTLSNSTLRPQDLIASMVRHCLNDLQTESYLSAGNNAERSVS